MIARSQYFKCSICGTIVEVVHAGDGTLVCCGQPMVLLAENTTDAAKEKHVPVITAVPGGYKVAVGSVPHPMEEKHYIEFIELELEGGVIQRAFLKPGDKPEALFESKLKAVAAREYCNLHGLWKAPA